MRVLAASLVRIWYLLWVAMRHGLAHFLGPRLARWPALARRYPGLDMPGPERLRQTLEDMGGTFIKFGQMLALQPDILSLRYCDALFNLLDKVPPFSYPEVERVFRNEVGKGPQEIFDSFEREPLAAASIGQVHVAYLDGRKMAVKVQRPTVEIDFGRDVLLMRAAIWTVERLRLRALYWMLEPLNEFVRWTQEELDYRQEARYMDRLRRIAEGDPIQHVPEVIWSHTTRRTLVVEFLEGVTLLNYLRAREGGDEHTVERLRAIGFDRTRFATHVIDNFIGDAFRHGIYHADLHPANLMILPDSVVGYVDFGITGVLSRHGRRHLVAMTLALVQGDMEALNEHFVEVSAFSDDCDVEAFRRGLDELALDWYVQEGRERRLATNFTQIMVDMLHLSRRTGVLPERDIIKYIRSSIAIDGLVTRFEAGVDVGPYLEGACEGFIKRQLRREAFSAHRLLALTSAGGRLIEDGPQRAARFLSKLSSGQLPAIAELGGDGEEAQTGLRQRAVQLGTAVLATAGLIAFGGAPPALGVNLFTAEVLFLGAATLMLFGTLRRLA